MTSSHTLTITDAKGKVTAYILQRIKPEVEGVTFLWRLIKASGEVYDVHADKHGIHCTCGDSYWRKGKKQCKHREALFAQGLLPGWKQP